MIELNRIYNEDCLEGMKRIPDGSIDLIVTDPPYCFKSTTGGGRFGIKKDKSVNKGILIRDEISGLSKGFDPDVMNEFMRICKAPNMYFFCNKEQVHFYLSFAKDNRLNYDILSWHKTNPVPACCNKYLSDTEYIIFMRGKGVKIYGSYNTKRKWYLTQANKSDRDKYKHPTCKPVPIIQNLIVNSSVECDTILDPFIGSGTTAIACMNTNRNFIGFELNKEFYDISLKRIEEHEHRKEK